MTRARSGFTLVEMLVIMVLGSLVLLAALQVLITNQRTYTAQAAVVEGQAGLRSAMEVLFNEMRLISPRDGDLLMMHSDSMRVHIMRKFSRVCDVSTLYATPPTLNVFEPGAVDFVVGDSVYIYADNNERNDDDDDWIQAQITGVAPGLAVAPCGSVATPGVLLTFASQGALFVADSVRTGAPVRSYETVRYALTQLYGDWYLGRAVVPGAITAVAGPLRATNGLRFVYRDSLNAVTTNPLNVRQIVVTVRSGSGVINSLRREVSDSLTSWIYTRN